MTQTMTVSEVIEGDTVSVVVRVNRSRTQLEALKATGCRQFTSREVVDSMPKVDEGSDEVKVIFFSPEPWEYTCSEFMSDEDLEKAFNRRRLKAADWQSVSAVNEDDPTFEVPHLTHWKDENGWCFIAFDLRRGGRRKVYVGHSSGYNNSWWFAGVLVVPGLES